MCGSASTRNYFQHVNDSTKRSCCLQFLAFLGVKEPLAIASFRYHLDYELFPKGCCHYDLEESCKEMPT